jgi:hypothetical protein
MTYRSPNGHSDANNQNTQEAHGDILIAIYKSALYQKNNNRQGIRFGVFLCLCFLLSSAVAVEGVNEPKRTLIGYSSELTVRPGDAIEFMVNAMQGGNYKTDLVRVINGESRSNYGDQYKKLGSLLPSFL